MIREAHLFALYDSQLAMLKQDHEYLVTDADLVHRIVRVLRLAEGDTLTLFNEQYHLQAIIKKITNKTVAVQGESTQTNKQLSPAITFLVPLLKKDALSAAIYGLTEAGATAIQLISCQKSQRAWGGAHEFERLSRVIIAAAEQSKNFAFPKLYAPVALEDAVRALPATRRYYGNPEGKPLGSYLKDSSLKDQYALLIGPEGDLTAAEKKLIESHGFLPAALTPTILRAESAAFCMVALVRCTIY